MLKEEYSDDDRQYLTMKALRMTVVQWEVQECLCIYLCVILLLSWWLACVSFFVCWSVWFPVCDCLPGCVF